MRINSCRYEDHIALVVQIMGSDHRLSEHFPLSEFQSRDGEHVVLVSRELIHGLEGLREKLGGNVMRINSGYRSTKHNAAEGGARMSKHLFGLAADVDVLGVHPNEVADVAEEMGFGGVGRYNTFTHVDVFGVNRRWDNRTPVLST
jgi:uncharacterized protein YcbK (DUF882 family)